jgi:hypothetical protein
MMQLVFLLEEPSAQDAIKGFLPKLLPNNISTKFVVFEGKQDLEKRMERTLRAWQTNAWFIVMRDQDSGDCHQIKQRLQEKCRATGRGDRCVVRVACRELESWFVGDWPAVAGAFDTPKLEALSGKAMYRDPDRLGSPVAELRKVIPSYQKRDGARRIGVRLSPENNQSRSFVVFCEAVTRIAREG